MINQRRIRTADGLEVAADVSGPAGAPTVILLHGGGQTRHSWGGAMTRLLEEGYSVVNYDARGHGDSDWSPSGDYSLRALASDLAAVRETIPARVALVGASMGGMTSFYAIGSRPSGFAEALVMVDVVIRPAVHGVKKIRDFMTAHQEGFSHLDEAIAAVAAYNPDRPRPRDPAGLRKNLRERGDGRLYWHWDPRLLHVSPNPEPPSFSDELAAVSGGVTVPTLLVRGGKSEIVDDAGVSEMRQLVPQTEVYDVPLAGHMVAGDRNDAFNDGVISFLQRRFPVG